MAYCNFVYVRSVRMSVVLAFTLTLMGMIGSVCIGQPIDNRKYGQEDKFRQLEEILPTPNGYRNAAGEPGPEYWQQRADYVIDVTLDDDKQHLTGSEQVTYHNASPHTLRYLWMQVDANIFSPDSDANKLHRNVPSEKLSIKGLERIFLRQSFDGSAKITRVQDAHGANLAHTIVKTMMRIDLPTPLPPGQDFKFSVDWHYAINDSKVLPGRTGYEYFESDRNYLYEIAQWFPRMVAFTDATGWQHKQFIGQGEFTLELGDYLVRITAPDDHIVAATGVLQNSGEVLSVVQRERLEQAKSSSRPVFIVTPAEALENQKDKADKSKTWIFHAQNVRDFAFASSRKFIWDAQGHSVEGNQTLAMSYYPNEAEPLWSKYSTTAIVHTLNVYSRYTFAYPYPIAISVNGPIGGMEYPMICFNGPRPESDGTYSSRTKYGLISVIIHEVGHNYFPMIVNSDERQWTWMDEGINTFLQYLSEQEWEKDYPSQRGEPAAIVSYMLSSNQVPIMTGSESLLQFGNNAYGKPATALNILRETILGRELFDYAFKEYARRWKFKRPMPADFFRTMEDASGVDLDWFWRGWFYTTDHCDIAIEGVSWTIPDDGDPDKAADRRREEKSKRLPTLSDSRNREIEKLIDRIPDLKDFYNVYDRDAATDEQREAFKRATEKLTPDERKLMESKKNFYRISLKNLGGLVMPVILRIEYADGTHEIVNLPAEIWQLNAQECSTAVLSDKLLKSVELDPYRQLADANRDNNHFPPQMEPSRFQLFKGSDRDPRAAGDNPMQAAKNREEQARKKKEAELKKESESQDSEKPAEKKETIDTKESESGALKPDGSKSAEVNKSTSTPEKSRGTGKQKKKLRKKKLAEPSSRQPSPK